jgi:hypothetical protein
MSKLNFSRNKKRLLLGSGIVLIVLFTTVYFRYYFVYSEGARVGILYKFSRKGTVYKTYEGAMVLPGIHSENSEGMTSNKFYFSVSDPELAKKLMDSQGMEIKLHYVQYNHGLPWRGDTYESQDGQYLVDGLLGIKNENPNGYGL